MSIQTAIAMPGTVGWMMAAELGDEKSRPTYETILHPGRYVVHLESIDCDGCAAAVESGVQRIPGVQMAGVLPESSVLVIEIRDGVAVTLSDLHESLSQVSEALKKRIAFTSLRGPFPSHFVSHSAA